MYRFKRNTCALAVSLALGSFAVGAHAGNTCVGNADCSTSNSAGAAAIAGASASASAIAGANASAGASAYSSNVNVLGQQQLQHQSNIGLGSGNHTAIQIDAPVIPAAPDKITIRNNPDVAVGGLYPSAACHGTSNAGFSGGAVGVAIGTSWKDDDCGIRETARIMDGMGLKQDALAVLCSSPYAAAAPSCKGMKQAASVSASARANAPSSICQTSKDEIVLRRNGCL